MTVERNDFENEFPVRCLVLRDFAGDTFSLNVTETPEDISVDIEIRENEETAEFCLCRSDAEALIGALVRVLLNSEPVYED